MYYTPPEVRREIEQFDVVIVNPPFTVTMPTAPGKTHVAARLVRRLLAMFARRSIVQVQP